MQSVAFLCTSSVKRFLLYIQLKALDLYVCIALVQLIFCFSCVGSLISVSSSDAILCFVLIDVSYSTYIFCFIDVGSSTALSCSTGVFQSSGEGYRLLNCVLHSGTDLSKDPYSMEQKL